MRPNGHVKVDPENLHTWLTPRIAQWQADGQGKIVDAYKEPDPAAALRGLWRDRDNLFCTPKGLDTEVSSETVAAGGRRRGAPHHLCSIVVIRCWTLSSSA